MQLAVERLPQLSTDALSDRVRELSPREANAQKRKCTPKDRPKVVQALQFRSLLVPLDGSKAAEHAIPWALDIASRSGGYIQFVHVHPSRQANQRLRPFFDWDAYGRRREKLHQEYVVGVAKRISKKSAVPVAPLFLEGSNIAKAIADAGRSSDLVVMAARRRGAMGRILCGSAVNQLLQHTTLPLLIAPGYNFSVERAIPKSIRRVLIPLDGSAESEAILDAAAELSSLTAAERTLIRVVPRLPYAGTPWNEKEDEALRYLNRVAVKLRRHPSAVRTEIASSDEAVGEVVLAYAQASDIDVIALTSRRGWGLGDRFVSSPVSYLIGKTHLPILVIRATPRKATKDAIGLEREMQQLVEAEAKMTRILDGQ